MNKVHNIYIGGKRDLQSTGENWAFVHACKSSYQERLEHIQMPKETKHNILFQEQNHLYIDWVDDPTGKYFDLATFLSALDFIDSYVESRKVFIHCDMGHSRGPTLGFVYLAKRTHFLGEDYFQALEKFQRYYPFYAPSGILLFVQKNWSNLR